MAERTKFVIGLKADNVEFSSDDSDGNFFSSDDDDEGFVNLAFSKLPPPPPKTDVIDFSDSEEDIESNKITDFMKCSKKITALVNQFSELEKPEKNFQCVYLVPETPATAELNDDIQEFIKGVTKELNVDTASFDTNLCCQIDMIRHSKSDDVPLKQYENSKLDLRISALLWYIFADTSDSSSSAYYLIKCLEDYVKYPSFAPISILYKDFTITSVVEKLVTSLCHLFHKHPILESVVHSLANIDPVATSALEKVNKEEEEKAKTLDEDSDEMSDSFFASLKQMANKRAICPLKMSIDNAPKNPLDIVASPPKIEEIKVKPPPSTVTYLLDDGTEQIGLQHFLDWINSFNPKNPVQKSEAIVESSVSSMLPAAKVPILKMPLKEERIPAKKEQQISASYQSTPIFPNEMDSNSATDINASKTKDYDDDFFLSLFDMFSTPAVLLKNLPSQDITPFFPIYYPTLEYLNQMGVSAAVKKGCPYPKLIEAEFNAHSGLKKKNSELVYSALTSLVSIINYDSWFFEPITPLKPKREMPTSNKLEDVDVVSALALANIEFIVNGRSPITGERMSSNIVPDGTRLKCPAIEKPLRITALYSLYKDNVFPPYILLKLAFALAIGCVDSQPDIACDLMFEGMYIFAKAFPQLKGSSFSRNAMLFLGETLEKTERYFNAALAFDVFLRSNVNDTSSSADIAQIAYRNKDMLRACYHYNQAIKRAMKENNEDQALYLCNTTAVIYSENGLNQTAINLYTYLLKDTYNLTVSPRRVINKAKINVNSRSGTVRTKVLPKVVPPVQIFTPAADSINTTLSGCMYAELLIKTRMFKQADELLTAISNNAGNILAKNVKYLKEKLFIKQNMYKEFLANFPMNEILKERGRNLIAPSRTSIDAGVTFDSKTALTILLTKAYLDRNVFRLSAFWSEMLIQDANKKWYKDVGIGFFLRGFSFFEAYCSAKVTRGPYSMTNKFDNPELTKQYSNPDKLFTINELAEEALSSLQIARYSFDHVGAIKKSTDASMVFLDTAISLFFNNDDPNLSIKFGIPTLLTTAKDGPPIDSLSRETVLTKENVCDELSILCNVAARNAGRIMNPIPIIYSQILQARLDILKGKSKSSKTFFDYAFSNLRRYFVNGPFFLPKGFSIRTLNTLVRITSLMVETLLCYEKEYINENLILFDIFNDIQITLHNKQCNKNPDIHLPLSSSINFDASALELHNPKLPSFVEILKDLDIVEGKENDLMNVQRGFASFFKIINANIHLFESQKITEDEMYEKNKQLCHKLVQIAENERRSLPHMNPVDPSFNVALKINASFIRTIFVFKVFDTLAVYIPATGAIRKISLVKTDKEESFSIKTRGETLNFPVSSPIGSVDFFEQMSSFIFVDKKKRDIINKKDTFKGMEEAKKLIFGELLEDENIFGIKSPSLTDDNLFDERSFFQSNPYKGALSTLAVGAPLIFYTGQDISALPLESLFKDAFVLRAQSYTKLLLHLSPMSEFPSVLTCRYEEDRDDLLTNGIMRSVDVVKESISNLGSNNLVLHNITKLGRKMPYPFPLFSSNKTLKSYSDKYEFSRFVQIKPNVSLNDIPSATLIVFTYADMVEMPELIFKLLSNFPLTFFMFIPAGVVREAYNEMKLIFARHKARQLWVEKNEGTKSSGKDRYILENNVLFLGAVQRTLMEKLKVPIPLFAPLGQE